MLSWYRDIYRGYWGFNALQQIYSSYPSYMTWDDHDIFDGHGSYYKNELGRILDLAALRKRGVMQKDARELVERMNAAAFETYFDYQHSHNPPTKNIYDYHFTHRQHCAFYVLDGHGHRDINRKEAKILGSEQIKRIRDYVNDLDSETHQFLFVVSTIPVLHNRRRLVNTADSRLIGKLNLTDDFRDRWDHREHDQERKALLKILFDAAKKGIRVCILSGDIHISTVFRIKDDEGNIIYQITCSPITFTIGIANRAILSAATLDQGTSIDGYHFRRLALYTRHAYSLIQFDPEAEEVIFKLYGEQSMPSDGFPGIQELTNNNNEAPEEQDVLATQSMMCLELQW